MLVVICQWSAADQALVIVGCHCWTPSRPQNHARLHLEEGGAARAGAQGMRLACQCVAEIQWCCRWLQEQYQEHYAAMANTQQVVLEQQMGRPLACSTAVQA